MSSATNEIEVVIKNFPSILFSMAADFMSILLSISLASVLENIVSSSRCTRANRSYLGMLLRTLVSSSEIGTFGGASDDATKTDETIAETFGETIPLKQNGPATQIMPLITAFWEMRKLLYKNYVNKIK